jgi:hypothetical protein
VAPASPATKVALCVVWNAAGRLAWESASRQLQQRYLAARLGWHDAAAAMVVVDIACYMQVSSRLLILSDTTCAEVSNGVAV